MQPPLTRIDLTTVFLTRLLLGKIQAVTYCSCLASLSTSKPFLSSRSLYARCCVVAWRHASYFAWRKALLYSRKNMNAVRDNCSSWLLVLKILPVSLLIGQLNVHNDVSIDFLENVLHLALFLLRGFTFSVFDLFASHLVLLIADDSVKNGQMIQGWKYILIRMHKKQNRKNVFRLFISMVLAIPPAINCTNAGSCVAT